MSRMAIDHLPTYIKQHWPKIRQNLKLMNWKHLKLAPTGRN